MKKGVKNIEAVAAKFQELSRKKKALDAEMQPLKDALVDYVSGNRGLLDSDTLEHRFRSGSIVQLRVAEKLGGSAEQRHQLIAKLFNTDYVRPELDEKLLIKAAKLNGRLNKSITSAGCGIVQKEVWAVYGK